MLQQSLVNRVAGPAPGGAGASEHPQYGQEGDVLGLAVRAEQDRALARRLPQHSDERPDADAARNRDRWLCAVFVLVQHCERPFERDSGADGHGTDDVLERAVAHPFGDDEFAGVLAIEKVWRASGTLPSAGSTTSIAWPGSKRNATGRSN
jgi:hypothetical protein